MSTPAADPLEIAAKQAEQMGVPLAIDQAVEDGLPTAKGKHCPACDRKRDVQQVADLGDPGSEPTWACTVCGFEFVDGQAPLRRIEL